MSTYVLVAGAWHGAWCWERVVPLLEQAGHTVVTLDLPGLGQDNTPLAGITLQSCADRLNETLDKQTEPVILAGHSWGGIIISQSAEQRPDKIKRLVYLTAFLVGNGESLLQWGSRDSESAASSNLIPDEEQNSIIVKEEAIKEAFYADCSDEDVAWAKAHLRTNALLPIVMPISITEANWGRVPRAYIECLQDKAITIGLQRQMHAALPCEPVLTLDTSHSPFISAPAALAAHLNTLQ